MAMLPYLLIVGAVVVAIMGLMKILDHFGIGLDDIINGLISFKDFILELPGKIADGFKSIFNKIQNFFIDAINGVIDLINKFKPGKDIEKLEKKPLPGENTDMSKVEMTAPGAGNFDTTSAIEQQDNAFLVPTTPDNGMSFMERMKTSPVNNDYLPTTSTPSSNSNAIIDNSVKTVNQNNTNQSVGISSRNNDNTIFRTSDIAV